MGTHHQPYFLEKAKEDLVHHSAARVTEDEASKRIRSNADQDMDARLDRTVSEQDAPSTSLDDLAEMYAGNCDDAVEVEDAPER